MCIRDSFYSEGNGGVEQVSSKAITVDGHDAWRLRLRVLVDTYGPTIPGDVVDIVVVQIGEVRCALLTFATIGDAETQRQVDASLATLRVEN